MVETIEKTELEVLNMSGSTSAVLVQAHKKAGSLFSPIQAVSGSFGGCPRILKEFVNVSVWGLQIRVGQIKSWLRCQNTLFASFIHLKRNFILRA